MMKTILITSVALGALAAAPAFAKGYTDWRHYNCGLECGQSALPGSPGEFGWAGAAKTYYWVDPVEQIVGVILTQHMVGFDLPEADFRAVVYQSIED